MGTTLHFLTMRRESSVFSANDVAQHNTLDDFWLIIHDKVYDVTTFAQAHPGGPVFEPYAGLDATDVFDAMHPEWVTKWLPQYCVGELDKPNATAFQAEYRALRADFEAEGVFDSRVANWVTPWFMGAVGSGYTYIWWSRKHNTHHAVPNVVDGDPDIDTMPILAWSERNIERVGPLGAVARFWVRNQALFFIPLLAFARVSWTIQSGMTVFEDAMDYAKWRRSDKGVTAWRFVEAFGQMIYWTWTLSLFIMTQI